MEAKLSEVKKHGWRATDLTAPVSADKPEEDVDQDELDARFEETTQRQGWSFNSLFLLCFPAASAPCTLVTVLWSDMGYGKTVYALLGHFDVLFYILFSLVAAVLVGLYLLDFWWPPHLKNKYCTLFEGDVRLRSMIFISVGLFVTVGGLCAAKSNPTVPPVITALFGPVLMAVIRKVTKVSDNVQVQDFSRGIIHTRAGPRRLDDDQKRDFEGRFYVGTADDARTFYAAAMSGFFLSGLSTGLLWLGWVLDKDAVPETGMSVADEPSQITDQRAYMRWCIPGLVAFFNMGLALVISLRVKLANSYRDAIRAEHSKDKQGARLAKATLARRLHMERLGLYTKVVNSIGFVLFGSTKAALEIQAVDIHSANLMLIFIGVFMIAYHLFMYFTFQRLARGTPASTTSPSCSPTGQNAIQDWIMELPLWRMMVGFSNSDWVRAAFLCSVFPAMPFLFGLSCCNQLVRKARGLYAHIQQQPRERNPLVIPPEHPNSRTTPIKIDPVPDDQLLTERFVRLAHEADSWDWVGIYEKMTLLSIAVAGSTISSKFINIALSWLVSMLQPLPFASLLAAAFLAGIVCFLLPPVPGVPVYLFTGVLVAAKDKEYGFWTCCAIAVFLAYIEKLVSSGVQQKCFGGFLGASRRVRSMVGVQKPVIRAIDIVLRTKGFSIPKFAIACGGPDWPTSVLAGVLGVPVWEMEVATLPVIFFIAPCVLSGAFFLKRGDGPLWESMANLMLQVTVVAALVLQLVAAWAIQDVMDKQNKEVTIPLEQNVELDWLDHASESVKEASLTNYNRMNVVGRICLFWGMFIEVLVAHVLFWSSSACFGNFAVTDDIKTLQLLGGDDPFITRFGILVLSAMCIGIFVHVIHRTMLNVLRRARGKKRMKDLAMQKEEWIIFRKVFALEAMYHFPYNPPPVPGVYARHEF